MTNTSSKNAQNNFQLTFEKNSYKYFTLTMSTTETISSINY